ncbi:MAG TPA: DUF481 domain-containing protein [Roseivirga sp.]
MIRSILLFFFIISLIEASNGQILSIDKSHLDKDTSNFLAGAIDLQFLFNNLSSTPQQENVYIGFFSKLDLAYLTNKHAILSINNFRYFKPGQGAFINSGVSHLNVNWFRKKFLTGETFVQVQYDQSRNLKERLLYGGGTRLNIISGDHALYLGTGAFYEMELWETIESTLIRKKLIKGNFYIGGEVDLNDHINLNIISYYQTAHDKEDDLWRNRVNSHLEIKDRLSNKITLKFSFDIHHDNHPLVPIPKWTYDMRVGLSVHFNRL